MCDYHKRMAALRRPGLLIRAARFGVQDYRRERDLKRLLGALPGPDRALARLMADEAALEEVRGSDEAGYDLRRHLDLLIAMMGEARLLPAEA